MYILEYNSIFKSSCRVWHLIRNSPESQLVIFSAACNKKVRFIIIKSWKKRHHGNKFVNTTLSLTNKSSPTYIKTVLSDNAVVFIFCSTLELAFKLIARLTVGNYLNNTVKLYCYLKKLTYRRPYPQSLLVCPFLHVSL